MFSYVSLEERVPQQHSLRLIRKLVDEIFRAMGQDFDALYAKTGLPSIPPERLLLFRWFVGLEMDEPVWNHAVFSKNRARPLIMR